MSHTHTNQIYVSIVPLSGPLGDTFTGKAQNASPMAATKVVTTETKSHWDEFDLVRLFVDGSASILHFFHCNALHYNYFTNAIDNYTFQLL